MTFGDFVWLVVIATSIGVFVDARRIGVRRGLISGIADMNPVAWLFACLFLWIIAFPIYLIKRPEFIRAVATPKFGSGGMVFCTGCGASIHSSAPTCPHCGAPQAV
jgi:hypothetical protein